MSPLFASAVPTWTDKEVLIAVGSTIAALIPVCLFVVRILTNNERRRRRRAEIRAEELSKKADPSAIGFAEIADTSELDQQIEAANKIAAGLANDLEMTEGEKETHRAEAEKLKADLANIRDTYRKVQADLAATKKRIERALKSEGPIWTDKVYHNTPEFRPLDGDERRSPIISVLNLKGGVGKMTIAANLGACLDGRGFRTLMANQIEIISGAL